MGMGTSTLRNGSQMLCHQQGTLLYVKPLYDSALICRFRARASYHPILSLLFPPPFDGPWAKTLLHQSPPWELPPVWALPAPLKASTASSNWPRDQSKDGWLGKLGNSTSGCANCCCHSLSFSPFTSPAICPPWPIRRSPAHSSSPPRLVAWLGNRAVLRTFILCAFSPGRPCTSSKSSGSI